MPAFGAKTMTMLIKEVAEDPSMSALDVTNNASVRGKPLEFLNQLAGPLKAHKGITKLVLRECDLNDGCCEVISGILAENDTIEEVDLQKNKITSVGAIALSEGLKTNKGLRTLDLMGQATSSASFGEETLERFLAVYQTNITLTKIIWRLESRKASSLATAMTRNVEIAKRQANGKPFDDLLPDGMREGRLPSGDAGEMAAAAPPADDGAAAAAAKEAANAEAAAAKKLEEEAVAAKKLEEAEAAKKAEDEETAKKAADTEAEAEAERKKKEEEVAKAAAEAPLEAVAEAEAAAAPAES